MAADGESLLAARSPLRRRQLTENGGDLFSEDRKVALSRPPDNLQIDIEVVMDDTIAHPIHDIPWNVRMWKYSCHSVRRLDQRVSVKR